MRGRMILDGTYETSTSVLLAGEGIDFVFCVLGDQQDPQEVVDALKELADAILDKVNEQPEGFDRAADREFLADEYGDQRRIITKHMADEMGIDRKYVNYP